MSLNKIQARLKTAASPAIAEQVKRIAPGSTKVYGIKMPLLNELAKEMKEGGFDLVESLWESGSYEEKMVASKMLRLIAKKDPEKAMELVENYSREIDNWTICDTLGMQSLKSINKIRPKEIFALANKLSLSKNMWQRRLSLVLVEDFCKLPEFHDAVGKLIEKQKGDKEYYIKKAVIWLESSMKKHI